MWAHINTLLWLRLVLFRRTMVKGKQITFILHLLLYGLLFLLAIGVGVGLYFLGTQISTEPDKDIEWLPMFLKLRGPRYQER